MASSKPKTAERATIAWAGFLFSAAQEASEDPGYGHYSPLIAILFSAAALEGFVNELIEDIQYLEPTDDRIRALSVIAGEIDERNAQLALKIQVIAAGLQGKPFDPGAQPFQDIVLLMRIRNLIMHARPQVLQLGDDSEPIQQDAVIRALAARGVIDISGPPVTWATIGMLCNPNVGAWAYESSVNMANALRAMLPKEWLALHPF